MTTREAFKAGFLACCAEQGLTGEQTRQCIEKAAELLVKQSSLGDYLPSPGTLTTAAVGLPIMAGAGVGYLAHRAAVPEVDDEDIKKQELIEELKHYARRAKEQQKVKALRTSLGV